MNKDEIRQAQEVIDSVRNGTGELKPLKPEFPADSPYIEAAREITVELTNCECQTCIGLSLSVVTKILARRFPVREEPARCPSCESDDPSYRRSAYDLPNRRLVECGNRFHDAASPVPSGEPVHPSRCSLCGASRLQLDRAGKKFGACSFVECKNPTFDYDRESAIEREEEEPDGK